MIVMFQHNYFIDKIFPALCGAGLGATIAVIGWLVSNHFAHKQSLFKFKNDFFEKSYWKINEALSEYQNWLAELNGQLQGFDRRNIEKYGVPQMDYEEKFEKIRAYILEDNRSDNWFHVFASHELIFPKYTDAFSALERRQNLIQEFCHDLCRQIKGMVPGQYHFDLTSIGFDRVRDQGKLVAHLGSNMQYDCLKPVIEGAPLEVAKDEDRPTISRDEKGKIVLLE